jgi:hypothetical protein
MTPSLAIRPASPWPFSYSSLLYPFSGMIIQAPVRINASENRIF